MIPAQKTYSTDKSVYDHGSIIRRLEALFLNNVGLVVTREQLVAAAKNPTTGKEPENWHQRLSELRCNHGYTILSNRDWKELRPEEYVLASDSKRDIVAKRVTPTPATWKKVLQHANNACEWSEDGQICALENGTIDPVGGGTVKLTADHKTPHSLNPNTDPVDPNQWLALCGRHQVMKKNFWDNQTGKINVLAILQAAGVKQKREAYTFLKKYFD